MRKTWSLALVSWTLSLSGCGYNTLQVSDDVNQYQRRADLVANLVNTVKGYAAREQGVLTEVTGTQPLHQRATGLQCDRTFLRDQPGGRRVRLSARTELHGGERKGDRRGAGCFL